jgi:ankyrin repeat protein
MIEHTFVFTKMYDLFFRGRFKHNRDKEGSKNPHLSLVKVEDILKIYEHLAVHSLFGEKILEKLNLDLTQVRSSLNDFKTNKDILGIVTKVSDEGKALFEHFTYREYFAARFFVNNFDKARLIREELLSDRRKNLMKVLSVILAEDNPLHLAVIYRNVDQIEKYFDDKHIYDKAGRNPLHLATFIEPRCVDRKSCMINVSIEAREYLTNIGILKRMVKFNYADCDKLFQLNALDYAFENKSFVSVEIIIKRYGYSNEQLHQYTKKYINNDNLITFCVTHGCIELLYLIFENSEKSKNYFKENASIIIEHTIKNCYFQLEKTLHFVFDTLEDKHDFHVNSINERSETLLHLAAMYGRTYAVQMLLEKGASVNVVTADNKTPLHLALENGHEQIANLLTETTTENDSSIRNVKTTAILTDTRASLDDFEYNNESRLHLAAYNGDVKTVKLLIDEGEIVDAVTNIRETPLHIAAFKGNVDIAELLIENGASVVASTKSGLNPLHYAAQSGNSETIALLIERGASVDALANDNQTPLHWAAHSGNSKTAELLIEKGASVKVVSNDKQTPLHRAAQSGNPEIVALLIAKGASVNVVATDNQTPLHRAAQHGNSKTAELLIEKGASVDAVSNDEKTPLHCAAQSGNSETVELLIEKGAAVNALATDNQTPLHWAARSGNSRTAELLIEKEASVNALATDNQTPLHWAAHSGNSRTVELLIEKGASVDALSKGDLTPLHYAAQSGNSETVPLLIEKGASVIVPTSSGLTPLHYAVQSGNLEIVALLIDKRYVDVAAADGLTALHYAAQSGNAAIVTLLIKKRASVHVPTRNDVTPLHYAAQSGNLEIVALLIEKQAYVDAAAADGLTALHYAAQSGNAASQRSHLAYTTDLLVLLGQPQFFVASQPRCVPKLHR